ncbi:MAG: hypothetical protein WBG38_03700, partial [Nodosilinea sp.]
TYVPPAPEPEPEPEVPVAPDSEPTFSEPELTEPELTEPTFSEPELTEPELAEPELTEPDAAQTEPAPLPQIAPESDAAAQVLPLAEPEARPNPLRPKPDSEASAETSGAGAEDGAAEDTQDQPSENRFVPEAKGSEDNAVEDEPPLAEPLMLPVMPPEALPEPVPVRPAPSPAVPEIVIPEIAPEVLPEPDKKGLRSRFQQWRDRNQSNDVLAPTPDTSGSAGASGADSVPEILVSPDQAGVVEAAPPDEAPEAPSTTEPTLGDSSQESLSEQELEASPEVDIAKPKEPVELPPARPQTPRRSPPVPEARPFI